MVSWSCSWSSTSSASWWKLCLILVSLLTDTLAVSISKDVTGQSTSDASYWIRRANHELERATHHFANRKPAKNLIFFLGDGMGLSTITVARLLKGQLNHRNNFQGELVFDQFPNIALLKTYTTDQPVPDSAGTATAFLCGFKTKSGFVCVDDTVKPGECPSSNQNNTFKSWLLEAADSGRKTGLITTTRITHATPAAAYAHVADRGWESDADMIYQSTHNKKDCKDIARQFIENTGNLTLTFGGGRSKFLPQNGERNRTGERVDSSDLISEWLTKQKMAGLKGLYSNQFQDFQGSISNYERFLGIFSASHLTYMVDRNSETKQPTLSMMVREAIKILRIKDTANRGIVLFIEGGRIDHGHHDNKAKIALMEVLEMDRAIQTAIDMMDLSNTLIIVTADHSHGFSYNGYPTWKENVLEGLINSSDSSGNGSATSLLYATGPGGIVNNDTRKRLTDKHYVNQATIWTDLGAHSGEDVTCHGIGPGAYLLQGVHEQSYVAQVIRCSLRIGNNGLNRPWMCGEKSPQGEYEVYSAGVGRYLKSSSSNPVKLVITVIFIFHSVVPAL